MLHSIEAVRWHREIQGFYAMFHTMINGLIWRVTVSKWTWIYTFSNNGTSGTVTWRDPLSGAHGIGGWKISGRTMRITWHASGSWDEWEVPFKADSQFGHCHIEGEGDFDLWADAQNYYLEPGDSLIVGDQHFVMHKDEFRVYEYDKEKSGETGTIAWVCRNPGNFRNGDSYGAYVGKFFVHKRLGPYAIFPTEAIGAAAIPKRIKNFGHKTIAEAMEIYAPAKDGKNRPDNYAQAIAGRVGVKTSTYVDSLSESQIQKFADAITGVEVSKSGLWYTLTDLRLPAEVSLRAFRRTYAVTQDEILKSIPAPLSW